jgi:DNA-binding MarR family transcriptional regulator
MIAAGHIRRESDPFDRRKVLLRYEPKGLDQARAFFTPLGSCLRTAMADLSDDDLATAHRAFCALVEGMRLYRDGITPH